MEVAAAKATLEPREGSERQNDRNAASQMARMGLRKRSSTWLKKLGYTKLVSGVEIRVFLLDLQCRGLC